LRGDNGDYPTRDRRGREQDEALFRATIDKMLDVISAAGEQVSRYHLDEILSLTRAAQERLRSTRELEHKMRNIAVVAELSRALSPQEAVAMIKGTIRSNPTA